MGTETPTKECYYTNYCHQCKWYKQPEAEEPCNECLGRPWNINSHKPINFEAKE